MAPQLKTLCGVSPSSFWPWFPCSLYALPDYSALLMLPPLPWGVGSNFSFTLQEYLFPQNIPVPSPLHSGLSSNIISPLRPLLITLSTHPRTHTDPNPLSCFHILCLALSPSNMYPVGLLIAFLPVAGCKLYEGRDICLNFSQWNPQPLEQFLAHSSC